MNHLYKILHISKDGLIKELLCVHSVKTVIEFIKNNDCENIFIETVGNVEILTPDNFVRLHMNSDRGFSEKEVDTIREFLKDMVAEVLSDAYKYLQTKKGSQPAIGSIHSQKLRDIMESEMERYIEKGHPSDLYPIANSMGLEILIEEE